MAKKPERRAGGFEPENTGFISGFLAEEDVFDRRATWRLGLWTIASIGAVVLAVYTSHSSMGLRRDQVASADLARQEEQIQSIAKESQNERRRLASAIDTLNGDRDRLYYRVSALEQGLESVTGTIAKQNTAAASPQAAPPALAAKEPPRPTAPDQAPAPAVSPVATVTKPPDAPKPAEKAEAVTQPEPAPAVVSSTASKPLTAPVPTPSPPLAAGKSLMGPPDEAAGKLIEPDKTAKATQPTPKPQVVAASGPADEAEADASPPSATQLAIQRTEFGVDVGGANSVNGLRALWRGLLKSKSNTVLMPLRPIIVIKENSNGLGMQLRLVAGPLTDAAAAAKICAGMAANERPCETTVFEGQRLTMNADDPAATPATHQRSGHWHNSAKRVAVEEPVKKPDPPPPSPISSFFNRGSAR